MIARARWCASLSTFLSIMSCASTTKKPIAWSTRCWTAGEEERADGNHAKELCQRNKMGAVGRLLAGRESGKCDSCLRHYSYRCERKHCWCGRCLRPSGADAQEHSIGIGARRRQHERCGANSHVRHEYCRRLGESWSRARGILQRDSSCHQHG